MSKKNANIYTEFQDYYTLTVITNEEKYIYKIDKEDYKFCISKHWNVFKNRDYTYLKSNNFSLHRYLANAPTLDYNVVFNNGNKQDYRRKNLSLIEKWEDGKNNGNKSKRWKK